MKVIFEDIKRDAMREKEGKMNYEIIMILLIIIAISIFLSTASLFINW